MTCVIWKYPLFHLTRADASKQQTALMSEDATLLHAEIIDAVICVWAETSPNVNQRHRTFELLFTGRAIPAGRTHVATLPELDTGLVWHLYEVTENG